MKILIIIYTLLFLMNAYAAEVKINSNPTGAMVYIENAISGKKIEIGKTPLLVNWDELEVKNGNDKPFVLEVNKEGFISYRLLVVGLEKEDLELNANLEINSEIKQVEDFDFLVADLFDVLRQIRTKNYKEALEKLTRLERKFPLFSVIPELKGSIHYLSKDLKEALANYRKAFSLNPKNADVYRMKKYLETHMGIDKK